MSDLFNYFVKAASTYKPDAAMRRGSYAQASDRGQYRSSTIGHRGLSKRTAAQLRQTYNLPKPGQQPTGPDGGLRRGGMVQGGQRRPTTTANPSPAPKPTAQPARPATVAGAPAPASPKPGSLAKTFAPHIPEVASLSDKDIRDAYTHGAYWDSHRGLMGADLDKAIQRRSDWQLFNRMSQLGLNTFGDNSAQSGAINTALQNLDALRYGDEAAAYNPLGASIAATQGGSSNATPEERALRRRPFDRSKIRPVMPRA